MDAKLSSYSLKLIVVYKTKMISDISENGRVGNSKSLFLYKSSE